MFNSRLFVVSCARNALKIVEEVRLEFRNDEAFVGVNWKEEERELHAEAGEKYSLNLGDEDLFRVKV